MYLLAGLYNGKNLAEMSNWRYSSRRRRSGL